MCNVIQYSTVPYSTSHTLPSCTLPSCALPYGTLPYRTLPLPHSTVPYSTVPLLTHTVPRLNVPYHIIPTARYRTVLKGTGSQVQRRTVPVFRREECMGSPAPTGSPSCCLMRTQDGKVPGPPSTITRDSLHKQKHIINKLV